VGAAQRVKGALRLWAGRKNVALGNSSTDHSYPNVRRGITTGLIGLAVRGGGQVVPHRLYFVSIKHFDPHERNQNTSAGADPGILERGAR